MAANPVMPYTFTASTPAVAAEVNANLQALVTWITNNAMQKDGSVAFTAVPSGPAANPTTDNELARKAYVDATANVVGGIQMYAGAAAPTGWLLCQGQAVSRTTYAALFAVCGTTFGAGDGSTTFNIPDMRGRSPIGVGTGAGLTARTLGQLVGTETHTLTGNQSGTSVHNHTQNSHNHTQNAHTHTNPTHNHTQDAHAHGTDPHSHGITQTYGAYGNSGGVRNTITAGGDTALTVGTAAPNTTGTTATNQAAAIIIDNATATNVAQTATNIATSAADAAEAHPNVHPSFGINYIIKH